MSARKIGRFIVRGELGRGGMGVVYRAEDPTLGRAVALKVLPPEIARAHHAREQLLAEARAAAVLDHPNICTVYEVGESAEGEPYLAMALYEGETLSARLERGSLTLAEATDIAVQTAQGLSAAHAIGLVHRDIKPSNLMLTRGGLVKILDFGIACAVTDPDVTGSAILGTPRYMSPEQLENVPDLDGRADVWALGVLFYEMLTGHPPFAAGSTQALLKSILVDDPGPVTTETNDFWRVKSVVHGLLEKDRSRRLTLDQFQQRITQPAALMPPPAPPQSTKSLAVLPFEHFGAEPDAEAFADGLTAEIIADLSKIRPLRVTSWTSVRRYRHTTSSARDLARELDVHYVLEGSVRRAGRDLRITALLVDATSDVEIWSGKYSGTLDDVFEIQERVSEAITKGLRVVLTQGTMPASARSIADPEAYDLYLRARGEIWSFTSEGPRRAIERIDLALQTVGPNALLLAARATALWQLVNTGASDLTTLQDAFITASRALDLDPESAPALRVLSLITAMRGDSTRANQLISHALDVAPSDPETLSSASFFFTLFGDGERASALSRRATELDPFYALHWTALGFAFASLGKDDDATAAVRRAFEVDSRDLPTRVIAPLILYGRSGMEAIAALEMPVAPATHAIAGGYAGLAYLTRAAMAGDKALVDSLVTPAVERFLGAGLHNCLYASEIFALVGDAPRSLAFLSRSAAQGLGCYPLVAKHSRPLALVRHDPAFADVLKQIEATWNARKPVPTRPVVGSDPGLTPV